MLNLSSVVKGWLAAVSLLFLSSGAWAGQSAEMVCTMFDQDQACVRYELRVKISSDADFGRVGGFGIGVQLGDGSMAYWTLANGFGAYRGGLVQPVEGVVLSLPAQREYLVFAGSPAELCSLARGQSFDMYAGRGSVPVASEAQLQFLLEQKLPMSADHIRGAYIQMDVNKNPWKVGLVYSWPGCNPNANGG